MLLHSAVLAAFVHLLGSTPAVSASQGGRSDSTTITARTIGTSTHVTLRGPAGRRLRTVLSRDSLVRPHGDPLTAHIVGRVGHDVFVVSDTYQSRSGGLSRCGAGEEQWLRVLAVRGHRLRETFRLKVASCWASLELHPIHPGLRWSADSSLLHVHWLFGPSHGADEARTFRVSATGVVAVLPPNTGASSVR